MTKELKPCPICGGDDILSQDTGGFNYFDASCSHCLAQIDAVSSKNLAIGQWNTRADDWISVDDRLPDDGGRYWCYVRELNDLGFSHYQWSCSWNESTKVWGVDADGTVTHWMPLPEPPK